MKARIRAVVRGRASIVVGFGISLMLALLSLGGWFARWQEAGLDKLFLWRGPRQPPRDVVIVAIDDESVRRLGRWPWRRGRMAELVSKIAVGKPKAIAIDVVFSEPSPEDDSLAKAARQAGNVFLAMFFSRRSRGLLSSYAPTLETVSAAAESGRRRDRLRLPMAEGAVFPPDDLRNAAAGVGHTNVFPELDGTLRRSSLYIAYRNRVMPSLPVAVTQFLASRRQAQSTFLDSSFQAPRYDVHGEMLLNFYGGYQAFGPYLPAYQVLNQGDQRMLQRAFRNRAVLIGVTATAISDLHATPFTPRCPGVEANGATALANLLHGDSLQTISPWITFAILLLIGTVAGALPRRLSVGWSALASLGMVLSFVAVSLVLFGAFHRWMDFTVPALVVFCTYTLGALRAFQTQEVERHRSQERMASLQRLSEMKSEYVSFVSHELRTPLTAIIGYAGTLMRDEQGYFDEATRRNFHETIHHEAARLVRMINELLDVARLEAGKEISINAQPIDALEAIKRAVATQQFYRREGDHGRAGHVYALDLPADLPWVNADPDRMEQMLLNLLSNAVKYSTEGGTITVGAHPNGHEVVFRIQDEGMGIEPGSLASLFQPYQRLEGAVTAKIRGTGLGLFLTRTLVEAQGGKIWAESQGPGRGSTFSFSLPKVTKA